MDAARNAARRESSRAWAFIATVTGLPLVVNPFGVPAFGVPRLTWLRAGAALLAFLLARDLLDPARPRAVRSSAWLPLAAVAASGVLSTVFSVAPTTSLLGDYLRWEGLWTLLCYWVVFVAALRWGRNRVLFEWLWPLLLAGGLVVSVIGILEFLGLVRIGGALDLFCAAGFGSSKAVTDRIISTFGNAAFLGAYLAMLVPIGLALALSDDLPRPWWRWLATGVSLACAVTLVMTYARAAWLGAALAVVLVLALARPDAKRLGAAVAAAALAITLAAGAGAVMGRQSLVARARGAFDTASGSLPQRLAILSDTLPMVRDRPLVGVGLDAFGDVFGRYQSVRLLQTGGSGNLKADRAHNDLLQVAATQGIVGLAAWAWFLVAFALAAARALRTVPAGWPRAALSGAVAAVLAYVVQAQFEFSTFVVAPLFWALAGLVWSGASSFKRREPLRLGPAARSALIAAAASVALVTVLVALSFWNADVAYNRGIAALYKRDAAAAIASYRQAVTYDPFEPLYRGSLGSALLSAAPPGGAARVLAEAAAQFEAARKLDPVATTSDFLAGNAYVEFGARRGDATMTRLAIAAYERGLSNNPRSLDGLSQVGRAYAFAGRWDDALEAWRKALVINPDSAVLLSYSARAYEKLGQKARAVECYRSALAIDPTQQMALDGLRRLGASGPG